MDRRWAERHGIYCDRRWLCKAGRAREEGCRIVESFPVAMWFDPSLNDAWEKGTKLGIEDAGYEAIRIDNQEHVNKIDDEIVAEIRRSRFVVADFTHGTTGLVAVFIMRPDRAWAGYSRHIHV